MIKFFPFWHQHLLGPLQILLSSKVYADFPNFYADGSPQTTIPTDLLIITYHPDIVIYNSQSPTITLLELTCPLDSAQHIQAARNRKQNKVEYLQLLAEFDRHNIPYHYETIEISVLGHYQLSTIKNLLNLLNFVHPEVSTSKSIIKKYLDDAASASKMTSRKSFLVREFKEWHTN